MEVSFHVLLGQLQSTIDGSLPPNKVSKVFLSFQKRICVRTFSIFPTADDLVSPFKILWEIFIEASQSPQTVVRMAVSRAVCSFIAKLTTFSPEQMITAFNASIRSAEYNQWSSPLIISAYTLISQYVAPPLLHNYFTFDLIERHFRLDNQTFSEFTADIVQNMGHMSKEFLSRLLNHMLENIQPEPSRHIVKAIGSLIAFYPREFLEKTIEKLGSRPNEYISLFASLLTSSDCDLGEVDISNLIEFCFESLSDPESPVHLIDNVLLILSVYPKLEVVYEDGVVRFKDETHNVVLDIEKVKTRSSFYALPLPLELLKPTDDEGLLVINGKFTTIGKLAKSMSDKEKKEVSRLFSEFISREYDEKVSAALRGLAECIEFIEIDNCLLKRIVTQKKRSWFHCLDIVRVIEKVRVTTLETPLVMALVQVITEFCLDKNETLSKAARKVMPRLISESSFEFITLKIVENISIFGIEDTAKMVKLLFEIHRQFPNVSFLHLNWFVCALMELIEYEKRNVAFLGDVLQYFSTFDFVFGSSLIQRITVIAQTLIVGYYEAMTDTLWGSTLKPSECMEMKEAVKSFLETHTVDIVSNPKSAAKGFLKPMKYAIRFVMKNPQIRSFNMELCTRLFRLAPYECSMFMKEAMAKTDIKAAIAKGHESLVYVGSLDAFAVWCDILRACRDPRFAETVTFVSVVACHYLHQPHIQDFRLAGVFCTFLSEMYDKGKEEVAHFVSKLEKEQVLKMFSYMQSTDALLSEVASKLGIAEEKPRQDRDFQYKTPEFMIDSENLQKSIRYAFLCENSSFLQEVLRYCDEKDVTIPFDWFAECPQKLIPEMNRYISKHIDSEYDVVRALNAVNTAWRAMAIEVIQRNPEELITALSTKEKVTKLEIENMCRLIGVVEFNKLRLLNLANIIFYEAKKSKRVKIALRFFTLACDNCGTVSDDLIVDFLSSTKQRMEGVSLFEIALCLKTLPTLVEDKYIFSSFINKLVTEWKEASIVFGSFYQVKLMFFDGSNTLPGFYAHDEETVIKSFLTSEMPSSIMAGLRLLKQAIKVMQDQAATNTIETLVNAMVSNLWKLRHRPWTCRLVTEIVEGLFSCRFFAAAQSQIVFAFDYSLSSSPSSPSFALDLGWLPIAVSKEAQYEQLIEKANLFEKIQSIEIFNVAMSVLNAHLGRLLDQDKSGVIIYATLTFLGTHSTKQSYFTLHYLNELSKLCESSPTLFMNFASTGLMSVRFFPMCMCLAMAVKRASDKDAIIEAIKTLEDRVASESERKAMEMLQGSYDVQALIELASADGD